MKKALSLIVYLLFIAKTCNAWGSMGHQLIGDIAKIYVNKSVSDSVEKYLGDMSWGKAAIWMDEIRSDGHYDYLKPMHYINVEKDSIYHKTDEPNIVNELELVMNKLKNRTNYSKEETVESLKILFHLIGDLEMPLHVGYGVDRGGNSIEVGYIDHMTNLHKVWDTELIEHYPPFKHELVLLSKTLTNAEIKNIENINVLAWMDESRAFLPQVYDFKKGNITEDYAIKNMPVIEKQILYGGIRLAAVLNSIFSIS